MKVYLHLPGRLPDGVLDTQQRVITATLVQSTVIFPSIHGILLRASTVADGCPPISDVALGEIARAFGGMSGAME